MSKAELIKKAESLGIETKGLTVAELETAIAAETALQPKQSGTGAEGDDQGSDPDGDDQSGGPGTGAEGDDQGSDQDGDNQSGGPGTGAEGDDQGSDPDGDDQSGEPGTGDGGDPPAVFDGVLKYLNANKSGDDEDAAAELKTSFEYNGVEYVFKKTAPERFNFLKQNKSQAEWLQDEDAMELLVTGNSHFVKPLKK